METKEIIEQKPIKQKTAHWIVMYECSRCGEIVIKRSLDTCPFCKAKMLNVKEK